MAIAYIQEYARLVGDLDGHPMQVGHEPALASQFITFTGTAAQCAAFNANTRFVRISLDTAGHLLFGANPTAVTNQSMPMEAITPEYFGVVAGQVVSIVT